MITILLELWRDGEWEQEFWMNEGKNNKPLRTAIKNPHAMEKEEGKSDDNIIDIKQSHISCVSH